MNRTSLLNGLGTTLRSGIGAPILLMVILAMMLLPLPAFALDGLFTFNIALSLVVLLAAIYTLRPLEFAAFPTVLLVATLLRLALNVASTRVVLIDGHTGTGAAGKVIEAFGTFVVGGSHAVGLVVFAILVVINFVVVTKGAGRISEVSARFTLDALPGKQMAIDSDLKAGMIGQEEARALRVEVGQEADFYGAMDGAGKFIRGDAIAGIIILLVNLFGGLVIGTLQHDLAFNEAVRVYALLTIGDGVVAQIPSLVLSTAAAIMVTRVSSAEDMGGQILHQLFSDPRPLAVTAVVVGIMGLVPGMPNVAFLGLAALAGGGAWHLARVRARQSVGPEEDAPAELEPAQGRDLSWDDVSPVDPLGLEVGYRLIPLVDESRGGELMARIRGVRRKATQDLGFLIPPVHIRDNLELPPGGYRLSVMGVVVGESRVHPEQELAINPGTVTGELDGETVRDPVFGLDAMWIAPPQRDHAQSEGYTVVDASTVVATHFSQALTEHAARLLGHQEGQQLLDRLAVTHPKLVEGLVPDALALSTVVKVLQNLLAEQVPVRDMRTIVECLAETATRSRDPDVLTAAVRCALGRFVVQQIFGARDEFPVITLDPVLDRILHQTMASAGDKEAVLEPGLTERLNRALSETAENQQLAGEPPVLVVSDAVRPLMARLSRPLVTRLHVLAFGELPDNQNIRIVATVGGGQ